MTVNEILKTIQEFSHEVTNPRNDGWTQEAYRQHLLTIQANVNEALANVNKPGATIPRSVATVPGDPQWWDSPSDTAKAVSAPELFTPEEDN